MSLQFVVTVPTNGVETECRGGWAVVVMPTRRRCCPEPAAKGGCSVSGCLHVRISVGVG